MYTHSLKAEIKMIIRLILLLALINIQQTALASSFKNAIEEENMAVTPITIETVQGHETLPYLAKLIELRLAFFRECPYFYEGNVTDEENYVSLYANSEDSLLTIAKHGREVIGIVTGLPLVESQNENKKLFAHKEIPVSTTFYIGEIVISEKYQNNNLEHKLYQQFEKSIKELKKYDTLLVCEVERLDSKQKENPFSSETHWEDEGFIKQPELNVHYVWQEIDEETKTNHLMVFWKKALSL